MKSLRFIFCFSIFTCLTLCVSCDYESSNSSSNSSPRNEFLAYRYAEDFVKKGLKSPGSAEFPGRLERAEHIKKLGFEKYEINSWVDSQNSFGAIIRTKFSCVIRFEGNKVHCEGLKLE